MRKSESGTIGDLLRHTLLGGLLAIALALALSGATAALILAGVLGQGAIPAAAAIIAFCAVLAGGLTAAKTAGSRRLFAALGAGALFLLAALIGRAAAFSGAGSAALPVLPCAAAAAAAAGLLGARKKKRRTLTTRK